MKDTLRGKQQQQKNNQITVIVASSSEIFWWLGGILFQFFADADDVDAWLLDTLRIVSSKDVGKDEASVQSLLKKHKVGNMGLTDWKGGGAGMGTVCKNADFCYNENDFPGGKELSAGKKLEVHGKKEAPVLAPHGIPAIWLIFNK